MLVALFASLAGILSGCMSLAARNDARKNEGNISPCLYPSFRGYEAMGAHGGAGTLPVMIVMLPFDLIFDTALLVVDLPYYGKRKWDESFWRSAIAENDVTQASWLCGFHLSHAGKEACSEAIKQDIQNGQGERKIEGRNASYEFKTPQNCQISPETLDFLFKAGVPPSRLYNHPNASPEIKTAAMTEQAIQPKH